MNKAIITLIACAITFQAQGGSTAVIAWGSSNSGQNQVPAGLTNAVAIAEGSDFSLALRRDGTVVAWGNHWDGHAHIPVAVPADLANVVAIAAGYDFSLALKSDGRVVAWGENVLGQTQVPPGLAHVVAITAGYAHSLALTSDGTVVAWGYNGEGQINLPSGLTNVTAVAAGLFHSLALKSDGTVVTWGGYCNFGDISVPPGLTDVVGIGGGCMHSLALKSDGTVVAWGGNGSAPQTSIPPDLTTVAAIAAGETHSLALMVDSRVAAWGANGWGESNVPAGLTNVVAIAGGWEHSLALVGEAYPEIATQPSSQRVLVNSVVDFRAVATGRLPLAYQWQFNGTNLPGATEQWLLVRSAAIDDTGEYRVLVSNAFGTATGQVDTLTVCDFAISPTNAAFGFQGGGATIGVVAAFKDCPWTVENPNNWVVIDAVSNGLGSGEFHFLVTSNRTTDSRSGTVTVEGQIVTVEQLGVPQKLLPQITRQPMGKTFNREGGRFVLHVGLKNRPRAIRPITYQWYFNGEAIPGATLPNLVLKHVNASDAGDYHLVISSRYGDVTSGTAALRFR